MELNFDADVEIVVRPAETATVRSIKILRIVDSPEERIICAKIANNDEDGGSEKAVLDLWTDDAYDEFAGFTWTQADVEDRLKVLLGVSTT